MRRRDEGIGDAAAIAALTDAAFRDAPHRSGTEAAIVAALREDGVLALSLVAEDDDGMLAGHVAFSPVRLSGGEPGWFGLGPVSVVPDRQGRGIGAALVRAGLARLRAEGADGCVVLGDPAYYARFGFVADARLQLPGVPPAYFQVQVFGGEVPAGTVAYADAFSASG